MATALPIAPSPEPELTLPDNTPVLRLREYLADAKRGHADFQTAWQFGRLRAVHGLSKYERRQWLLVLDETQHEWSACYHNRQTAIPRLVALQRLMTAA
jgi:hypothetical protein